MTKQNKVLWLFGIISTSLVVFLIIDPFGWLKNRKAKEHSESKHLFVAPETFSLDYDKLNVEQIISKVNDIVGKDKDIEETINNNSNEISKSESTTKDLAEKRNQYIKNKIEEITPKITTLESQLTEKKLSKSKEDLEARIVLLQGENSADNADKIKELSAQLTPITEEYDKLNTQLACFTGFKSELEFFDIYKYKIDSSRSQKHSSCIDSGFVNTFYPMVQKEKDALLFQATLIKVKYILLAIKKISKYYFELKYLLDCKKEESILCLENTFYQTQHHLISLMSMLKGIEKDEKAPFKYNDLFPKTVSFLTTIDSYLKAAAEKGIIDSDQTENANETSQRESENKFFNSATVKDFDPNCRYHLAPKPTNEENFIKLLGNICSKINYNI